MHRTSWIALALVASPALAQPAEQPPEPSGPGTAVFDEEIVVTGQRLPGAVGGPIPPELQLTPGDIRSYGVSSLSDLLTELAPQTTSGRGGQPVVLLGGKRISGFAEIRDIPTEAILRIEILPEEVALKFGYRAEQKVVNVILRPRFRAVTAEVEGGAPTQGGQATGELDTSLLRIQQTARLNLALKYEKSSALTEAERDIVNAAGSTDQGRFRTLLPETDALTANAVFARTILGDVSATVNGSFTANQSRSTRGLADASLFLPAASPFAPAGVDTILSRDLTEVGALGQRARDYTAHLGTTLNVTKWDWNWTLTGNYDRVWSRTRTETGVDLADYQARLTALDPLLDPAAPIAPALLGDLLIDRARSRSDTANLQLLANGTLATLPAGPISASFRVNGDMIDFSSRSLRAGRPAAADLSRDIVGAQASFDLPIASKRRGFAAALGELSANFNVALDRPSDFGTLTTLGYGLNWTPVKPLTLIASVTEQDSAPSVQQLGNPTVIAVGARVFDYVRAETVDITRITGGNPALRADDRRVIRLGATLKPLAEEDLTLTANYVHSRIDDPIAAFPTATAAIEAAFPERFLRENGRLVSIDSRPINFARQTHEELRWGINFSKRISAPEPEPERRPRAEGGQQEPNLRELLPPEQRQPRPQNPDQSANEPGRAPGGQQQQGGGFRGPGGPGGGFGGPGGFGRGPGGRGTRLQLAVYHTINLTDTILIGANGPRLDLLDGDAIGSAGGQPRNQVQVQAGLTRNGFGARLNGQWQQGTTVRGGLGNASALRFSSLTTFNLRLFADLGAQRALVEAHPFLRGSRISIGVSNLFNQRIDVRDAAGINPVGFQPGYLDPLGRAVRISFRKLFFPPRPSGPPPR